MHASHALTTVDSVIGGIFFTVAGGLGLATVLRDVARARESRSWPEVDGEVIHSDVETTRVFRSDITRWSAPRVRYRYHVGGRQYTSDRVRFGGLELPIAGPARRVAAKYPKGHPVKVRVSPSRPHLSVLEPGATWYSYLTGIGMAVFLGVGFMFFRSLVR